MYRSSKHVTAFIQHNVYTERRDKLIATTWLTELQVKQPVKATNQVLTFGQAQNVDDAVQQALKLLA